MDKAAPVVITARYRPISENGTPVGQPIFNNWRNAVPLLALIAIRTAWVLLAHR
jgi:hypothetical protein